MRRVRKVRGIEKNGIASKNFLSRHDTESEEKPRQVSRKRSLPPIAKHFFQ